MEDVWLRQPNGLKLLRVFHADRMVFEYAPGELAALGVRLSWDDLTGLVSPADQATLKTAGSLRAGRVGNDTVSAEWPADDALPQQLTRRNAGGEVRFVRSVCSGSAEVDVNFDGYGRIDAADFGDMEYNPVVRKAMAHDERIGWREAHAH